VLYSSPLFRDAEVAVKIGKILQFKTLGMICVFISNLRFSENLEGLERGTSYKFG
jgi:hypothetical protein